MSKWILIEVVNQTIEEPDTYNTYKEAYAEMEKRYNILKESNDEYSINDFYATIQTDCDNYDWRIYEVKCQEDNIKNATFTSVWDGGHEVTTNCKVNMITKEVFDIEVNEDTDEIETLNNLDYEYITIEGSSEYDVYNKNETEINVFDFWYE